MEPINQKPLRTLVILGGLAPLTISVALALLPYSVPLAGALHLALAMAVLPLILAVMIYFTPVLTRTPPAAARCYAFALVGMIGGSLGAYAVSHNLYWVAPALFLVMLTVAAEWYWIEKRAQRALGVQPCLYWYRAALACLMAGLFAMLVAAALPEWWQPMKRLHLHLNLLGFVGLTAIGTLQVLVPTVAAFRDEQVHQRVARHWRWMLAGVLLVAIGAATQWRSLALAGALLVALPIAIWLWHLRGAKTNLLAWHGAGASLSVAIGGFLLLLGMGVAHATRALAPQLSYPVLVSGFLLPLITGALSHLLPLWRFPAQFDRQKAAQREMQRWSLLRALGFLLSALLLTLQLEFALAPALLAATLFLVQLAKALKRKP